MLSVDDDNIGGFWALLKIQLEFVVPAQVIDIHQSKCEPLQPAVRWNAEAESNCGQAPQMGAMVSQLWMS